jgi:hypothetical protein
MYGMNKSGQLFNNEIKNVLTLPDGCNGGKNPPICPRNLLGIHFE